MPCPLPFERFAFKTPVHQNIYLILLAGIPI
jgi:hypothetical protein